MKKIMINSFIQIVLVYTSTIEFLKTQLYGLYFISFVLLFYFFLFIIAYMVDEGLNILLADSTDVSINDMEIQITGRISMQI